MCNQNKEIVQLEGEKRQATHELCQLKTAVRGNDDDMIKYLLRENKVSESP